MMQFLGPSRSLMQDSADLSEENCAHRLPVGVILPVFLSSVRFYMQWN